MSDGIFLNVPEVIRTYNVSRSISTTTTSTNLLSIVIQASLAIKKNPNISPAACFGFVVLILATVLGNTLVLSALFLDKRLHSPSFFLIANMAIADLLLGLSVLPFSSTLELLNDRWIFGQGFCSAWLALDVLCCTASIIALMAVSIDRYIGVTRPLNYSSIMTTRRTIYLIIIVWTVSILTSVVPLFGLTDPRKKSIDLNSEYEHFRTCTINKNTFYTIFSSMISFYIPVIILLILYSRVYQEAKKQGEKLENERRRLYQIDYQIASEQVRQKQTHSNGHSKKTRISSIQSDDSKNEVLSTLLKNENIAEEEDDFNHTLTSSIDGIQLKKDYSNLKKNTDDDVSRSEISLAPQKSHARRLLGKRLYTTMKRNSILHTTTPHPSHSNHEMTPNDELLIIKRKLNNLKREKKAFRTLGLILGALLICWLPFFVTLPVISILKHHGLIKDENTENTWFKITVWLGYCNSALNPFVYAFSNRAIRRGFRQVIFRRCCCCVYRKKSNQNNEQPIGRCQRAHSGSLTTETSQIPPRRTSSFSKDIIRTVPKTENDFDISPTRTPTAVGPVVSFADFLAETGDDDDDDDKRSNQESIATPTKKNLTLTSDS